MMKRIGGRLNAPIAERLSLRFPRMSRATPTGEVRHFGSGCSQCSYKTKNNSWQQPNEIPRAANRVLRYMRYRVRAADRGVGAKLLVVRRHDRTCKRHPTS